MIRKRGVRVTKIRLGYVAMSVNVKNCSPSQTVTYKQFAKLEDRNAAIRKLERAAKSNVENCLRLLKHNLAHDIRFFRLSSRLVPLATHQELEGWDYLQAIKDDLQELGQFAALHEMRLDFHPDHFNVINTPNEDIFRATVEGLRYHQQLLQDMNIDLIHRLVLHIGGLYNDREKALERFITNWGIIPHDIQQMIMLENDDKVFTVGDALYLGEKLGAPVVFDFHHQLVNHREEKWEAEWGRVIHTWQNSPLPVKMHISSPKNEKDFRAHADFIDSEIFMRFLQVVKGSVPQIDCMIEAKQKDQALFYLMEDMKQQTGIEIIDGASFNIR
jgi:UV DNA damage endonuclease